MRFTKIATASALAASLALASFSPAAAHDKVFPLTNTAGILITGAAVGTLIVDAVYVSATQCRELTSTEAWTGMIPVVGLAINAYRPVDNHCAHR
jgi:hypothetical protein